MTKDRMNYSQGIVHMLKGNLGTGILAMPLSFKHLGYASAIVVLPLICLICGYCVHILVRSSRHISKRLNDHELTYSVLAGRSFELGPSAFNRWSKPIAFLVDTALLVTQIGVCCVYIIFVADNVNSILASYKIHLSQLAIFLAIFPIALALSCIRTLNRLAIASLVANVIQVAGLVLIIEYLARDFQHLTSAIQYQRPHGSMSEMALGFGSVMFAFEGISVVLPLYNKQKRREQFASLAGVVNVAFVSILMLYFVVGFLGFLRYGQDVKDSITLNLPAEPFYDVVRAMFTLSILLSYPLQMYVPNEIIWSWTKKKLESRGQHWAPATRDTDQEVWPGGVGKTGGGLEDADKDLSSTSTVEAAKTLDVLLVASSKSCRLLEMASPPARPDNTEQNSGAAPVATPEATILPIDTISSCQPNTFQGLTDSLDKTITMKKARLSHKDSVSMSVGSKVELVSDTTSCTSSSSASATVTGVAPRRIPVRYEYYCRMLIVTLTFVLAICIPKLNLLMDLIGSFSGTLLGLTIPALVHMAAYWERLRGPKKCLMIMIDIVIITLSLAAGLGGSYSSLIAIVGDNSRPQMQKP